MQDAAEKALEQDRVRERADHEQRDQMSSVSHLFVKTRKPDLGVDVTDQELVDAEAQGMTHVEIAHSTGLALAMVPVRLRRAKARRRKPRKSKTRSTGATTAPQQEEKQMVQVIPPEIEDVPTAPEEEIVEATSKPVVQAFDDGDPWEGAADLARRHQLVPGTISYRYKRGSSIDGRVVERRTAVNPTHAQQKWEWRLGAHVDEVSATAGSSITSGPAVTVTVTPPEGVVEQMHSDIDAALVSVDGMSRDLEDVRAELEIKTRELAEERSRLADARGFIDTQRTRLEKANSVAEQLTQERDALRVRLALDGAVLRLDLDGWGALQRLAGMLDTLERAADGGAQKAAAMMIETLDAVLEGGAA